MAAGLRLSQSDLGWFQQRFEAVAAKRLTEEDMVPAVDLDAEVSLGDITPSLLHDLDAFEPFGAHNREPLLAAYDLAVPGSVKRIGGTGSHLSFYVRQNGLSIRAVAFGMGGQAEALGRARLCSAAFVPKINRWRGRERVELEVRDLKIGRAPKAEPRSSEAGT